jgi:hypothetical protein
LPALAYHRAMELWRATAGGCVRLRVGDRRWALCVLPTATDDPRRAVSGLGLEAGERIEALVVLDREASGHFATAALAEALGLAPDQVHRLSKQKKWWRFELDDLTMDVLGDDKRGLHAFWFGEDDTLRVGADLLLDAWARPLNASVVVGTLRAPKPPKDDRRLQEWGETGALGRIRVVEILRDVVGAAEQPWAARLPPFGTRVTLI